MFKNFNIKDKSEFKNPTNFKTKIDKDLLNKFEDFVKTLNFSGISYLNIENSDNNFNKNIKSLILIRCVIKKELLAVKPSLEKHRNLDKDFRKTFDNMFKLSDFLRKNNFYCEILNPISLDTDLREYAVKSNVGIIGRNKLCIFKEGPGVIILGLGCSIENFPIKKENELLWIKDYCRSCGKCIRKCPEHAFDAEGNLIKKLCTGYKNGCGICILSCPFFKKDYETIKSKYFKKLEKLSTKEENSPVRIF